jgi:catechol 2,3-dioxygenase-like lactoylglutathione lyase family enzyme
MASTPKPQPIPDRYRRVTPALVVDGAARALDFYADVFGVAERMRVPGPGGAIAHAEIEIGDSVVMVEDASPFMGLDAGGQDRRLPDLQGGDLHGHDLSLSETGELNLISLQFCSLSSLPGVAVDRACRSSCCYRLGSRSGRRSSGTGMGRNALTLAPPVFPTG